MRYGRILSAPFSSLHPYERCFHDRGRAVIEWRPSSRTPVWPPGRWAANDYPAVTQSVPVTTGRLRIARLKARLILLFNLLRQPLVVIREPQYHFSGQRILHSVCESTDFIGASVPEFGVVGRGPADVWEPNPRTALRAVMDITRDVKLRRLTLKELGLPG
jgi:hypothetical protein